MECKEKKTKYEVEQIVWACPNCGEKDDFWIDSSVCTSRACKFLHEEDELYCSTCDRMFSGIELAEYLDENAHPVELRVEEEVSITPAHAIRVSVAAVILSGMVECPNLVNQVGQGSNTAAAMEAIRLTKILMEELK